MTERITVDEIKSSIREGIRRSLDGLDLLDHDGPEIVVERDPENPERVLCELPVYDPTWEDSIGGTFTFYVTPETPVGCRR